MSGDAAGSVWAGIDDLQAPAIERACQGQVTASGGRGERLPSGGAARRF